MLQVPHFILALLHSFCQFLNRLAKFPNKKCEAFGPLLHLLLHRHLLVDVAEDAVYRYLPLVLLLLNVDFEIHIHRNALGSAALVLFRPS